MPAFENSAGSRPTKNPALTPKAIGISAGQKLRVEPRCPSVKFDVKDVDNQVCFAIQQDDVATDQDVSTVRRRRRKAAFQFFRAGIHALLEPWRKRASANKLFFQARRELILLCQAGREMSIALHVPPMNRLLIMRGVVVIRIVIVMLVVPFAVAVAIAVPVPMTVALGESGTADEEQNPEKASEDPFRYFHRSLLKKGC
jgi:hypothetical protein